MVFDGWKRMFAMEFYGPKIKNNKKWMEHKQLTKLSSISDTPAIEINLIIYNEYIIAILLYKFPLKHDICFRCFYILFELKGDQITVAVHSKPTVKPTCQSFVYRKR